MGQRIEVRIKILLWFQSSLCLQLHLWQNGLTWNFLICERSQNSSFINDIFLLTDAKACKWKRTTLGRQEIFEANNYKFRKPLFKLYGMYGGGLQHVSDFMSVTLDQWPELMRCYMLPGTQAGKLLFWCTLESGEFQKSSIWWKTEQPSVAQRSLTSGIYWDTIPCWEKVSTLMRTVPSNFTNFLPSGSNTSQERSCQCLSIRKYNGY